MRSYRSSMRFRLDAMMAMLALAVAVSMRAQSSHAQSNCVEWVQRGEVLPDWPDPRGSFALAYDRLNGQTLYVGGSGWLEPSNDTWGWDGRGWSLLSEGQFTARSGHLMVYDTHRETTVMFGGLDFTDTWERGSSGQWQQVATTGPSARVGSAMVYDAQRGVTVLFGGYDTRGFNRADTWEWNGQEWILVAESGPAARRYHSMSYDSRRGVTVLYGGYTNAKQSDTWEWDGESWALVDEVGINGRTDHQMTFDEARGVSLLFGGIDNNSQTRGDLWSWDGAEWVLLALSGAGEHSGHRVAFDRARAVMVLIGSGTSGRNVWEWDGVQWRHYFPTDLSGSIGHAMVYDPVRRRIVMFGGYTTDGLSGKTWEWDGAEWILVSETGPSPRSGHAMIYDTRRRVTVLFGGGRMGDLWEWDGEAWTEIQASGPEPRGGHAMAYDSLRGEIVIVGGYGSGYLRDTWAYRDGSWRFVTDRGPTRRTGAKMVYYPGRDAFVLYGGEYSDYENTYVYDETWTLDRRGWQRVLEHSPPGDLMNQAMTFDTDRWVILMHGGMYYPRPDTLRNKLWQWDGAQWSLLSSGGPTARADHAVAYDTNEGNLVLFGGFDEQTGLRGDTWTYGFNVAPTLALDTSCPQSGPAVLTWSCASPEGSVALGHSLRTGYFRIPNGQPCAGTLITLDPDSASLLGVVRSNAQGGGSVAGQLNASACGGYVQLIDAQTCFTSNVLRIE